MTIRNRLAFFLLAMTWNADAQVSAHDADGSTTIRAPKFPPAIVLPSMSGPKPWSDKPLADDPDRFQIAIMSDHTGGHRPGIWMKAVERINHLRPTFVMSVGDLIEGDAVDVPGIEAEWAEFLGFIDQMQMKFFFVSGNHDVGNPLTKEIWKKHFGTEWYSFDYKGVHFVCLSSEDPRDRIGDQQLAWLKQDLQDHTDARWTLLFLHKPLWVVSERALAAGNPDTTGWKTVESYLGSRPHTVFAGHVHHYTQYDRNGMKYYHLGTTGGSSQLRGIPYGEFDHVTWLTMESDGPSVANLLLDGILPGDAITEKKITRFRDFLARVRLDAAPILIDGDHGISSGRIEIRLQNDFDVPVEVTAEIAGLPLRGLTVDPASLMLTAAAGETRELSVSIRFGETISFPKLTETVLTAKVRTINDSQPLFAERTIPVVIDQKFECPKTPVPVRLDGNITEWPPLTLKTSDRSLLTGSREKWQGDSDAAVQFTTTADDRNLFIAAQITDDSIQSGDSISFRIDGRWIADRRADTRLRKGTYLLTVPAPGINPGSTGSAVSPAGPLATINVIGQPSMGPASVVTSRTSTGWNLEAAIPVTLLTANQSDKWHSFQMTPILSDVDDSGDSPVEIIWRGTSDVHTANTSYGHFVRAK
ncbi:MAG: metallophosphoesterase [Planctomyces sp.]